VLAAFCSFIYPALVRLLCEVGSEVAGVHVTVCVLNASEVSVQRMYFPYATAHFTMLDSAHQ
jgi:hypothetical protein